MDREVYAFLRPGPDTVWYLEQDRDRFRPVGSHGKVAKKRAEAGKPEPDRHSRNSKSTKVDDINADKDYSWLEAFGVISMNSLYNLFEYEGERKTYSYICSAVRMMKQKGGPEYQADEQVDPTIDDKREYSRGSRMLHDLSQILNFDEKKYGVSRAKILEEAVQDWRRKLETLNDNPQAVVGAAGVQELAYDRWRNGGGKVVVHALCLVEPTLAFDSVIKDDTIKEDKGDTIRENKDDTIKENKDDTIKGDQYHTPFGAAAEHGATDIVKVMLKELIIHLRAHSEQDSEFQKALLEKIDLKPEGTEHSAFIRAARNHRLDVLRVLLAECPRVASTDGLYATIARVVHERTDTGRNDPALDAFKLILQHMNGLGDMTDIWTQAVRTKSLRLVKYLIKRNPTEVTYKQFALIVEHGTADMWRLIGRDAREDFLKMEPGNLLHTAVCSKNAGIVESILNDFPQEIEKSLAGSPKDERAGRARVPKHPMEDLGDAPQDKNELAVYTKIRNLLLDAMIRSDNPSFGIGGIRAILSRSKANTICLHLSTIDTEERRFSEYVDWLTDPKSIAMKIFNFEKILKYANFPDLSVEPPNYTPGKNTGTVADLQTEHCEIRKVFEWLSRRSVQEVLELSVDDRLFGSHSNEDVAFCVNTFSVRVLKWKKLDLYLPSLKIVAKDKQDNSNKENVGNSKDLRHTQLRELHLYSSGNQSVLDQWYEELEKFPNLRKLYVYIVTDVLGDDRAKTIQTQVQLRLDEINKRLHYRWTKHLERNEPAMRQPDENASGPKQQAESEQAPVSVPVSCCQWAREGPKKVYRKLDEITNDVVGSNLSAFIGKYKGHMAANSKYRRTKVAVIDSGIVLVGAKEEEQANDKTNPHPRKAHDYLSERVVDGTAFVSTIDNEEPVWWHASEPHGTQMARLICSIDPCCELFVVKVAETRSRGIPANNVADAINWAIRKDVDVISLSLVTYSEPTNLNNAIKAAAGKDIVIITSTADQGVQIPKTATDSTDLKRSLYKIAACSRWGGLLESSQKTGYDYGFLGHNVRIGRVPFLRSEETISGSSVATAIAAGAASLTLACCRIAIYHEEAPQSAEWRKGKIDAAFDRMSTNLSASLEEFCGRDKNLADGDFMKTVKSCFGSSAFTAQTKASTNP